MSATCQCGAPLTGTVEQWTGECEGCCPPSLECRFPSTAHIATASVNGRARLALKDAARDAAFGYSVEFELSQVGPEPSDLLPDPADWIDIARSGDIPPHGGRRCPECGYPLDEQIHNDGFRTGWLLCPCCDSYHTGPDAPRETEQSS